MCGTLCCRKKIINLEVFLLSTDVIVMTHPELRSDWVIVVHKLYNVCCVFRATAKFRQARCMENKILNCIPLSDFDILLPTNLTGNTFFLRPKALLLV